MVTRDDLELLNDFRLDARAPDEDTVRRIYASATNRRARREPGSPLALLRRPRLALIAAATALVLAPAALAVGTKIVELFEGAPASPSVSDGFQTFNRLADTTGRAGFAKSSPHAVVDKAHGVMRVQTSDGPLELWTAPNDQGGRCWFIDFADDPLVGQAQNGWGGCDSPPDKPESNIAWNNFWWLQHPTIRVVDGRVYVKAATVRLGFADGSDATLPVVNGFFLGAFGRDARLERATALDDTGTAVAVLERP